MPAERITSCTLRQAVVRLQATASTCFMLASTQAAWRGVRMLRRASQS
jgi:hypothetical protein